MKINVIILLGVFISCLFSCSKNEKIQQVTGTVNGLPATTLYGNSGKPTDYIFICSDSSKREMSYGGVYLTYSNTTSSSTGIFILQASIAVAKADLAITGSKTVLTIDTAYGISFASTQYASD